MTTLLAQKGIGGNISPLSQNYYTYEDPSVGLTDLFSNLFSMFTFIAGLAFIVYFVLGAIAWITSGGDAQKLEKARNQMTNAAIGLIAVVAAYSIIAIVGTVLGLDILNPTQVINNLGPN